MAANVNDKLIQLEREYWQALKDNDRETVERLTDETCLVVGTQGMNTFDRNQVGAQVDSMQAQVKDFEFDDRSVQVKRLSRDMALVAYKVKSQFMEQGSPTTIDAYDTTLWVRRDGEWVATYHSETPIGLPAAA